MELDYFLFILKDATRLHSTLLASIYARVVLPVPSADQAGVLLYREANNKDMEVQGWVLSLNV